MLRQAPIENEQHLSLVSLLMECSRDSHLASAASRHQPGVPHHVPSHMHGVVQVALNLAPHAVSVRHHLLSKAGICSMHGIVQIALNMAPHAVSVRRHLLGKAGICSMQGMCLAAGAAETVYMVHS